MWYVCGISVLCALCGLCDVYGMCVCGIPLVCV